MLYADGYKSIDTVNCRNTSNKGVPDKGRCESIGGAWIEYPQASNGPKGMCESPNNMCITLAQGIEAPDVCQKYDDQLDPLFNFLLANKAATGYDPQLGAGTPHTTRMYS